MLEVLKKHFGYNKFRPLQEEVIESVMNKKDTLVVMPTGAGKSLCFQLPALLMDGLTIVVSPLIALMKDQVDSLNANGISAAFINSSLSDQEKNEVKLKLKNNEIKLLYIAPERLDVGGFKEFLKKIKVSLIAVDEAHCISEWGHDFRPSYNKLQVLKEICPEIPIVALTATATVNVQKDILAKLSLSDANSFLGSFDRPNLSLKVFRKRDSFAKIVKLLETHKGESAIIYCFSRKETEKIAEKLRHAGHNALPYHAGLSTKIREKHQELFSKDEVDIIVATIAFGMGIDKPDVRLVVHYVFPKTLESYYQELGRAGRDGLPSDCVLFYSIGDKRKHDFFIDQMPSVDDQEMARINMHKMIHYCELDTCRRSYLLSYFGDKIDDCGNCNNCVPGDEELLSASVKSVSRKQKSVLAYNENLFVQLRGLRKELAVEMGIAPFMVFSDLSLQEMSYYFPSNSENFLQITGVGEQKLETFGSLFLKKIEVFVQENNIQASVRPQIKSSYVVKKVGNEQRTLELLKQKISFDEIVVKQGFQSGTIVRHIHKLIDTGEICDIAYLKPDEIIFSEISLAYEHCGNEKMKPIFEHLDGKYSYDEIRLVGIFC